MKRYMAVGIVTTLVMGAAPPTTAPTTQPAASREAALPPEIVQYIQLLKSELIAAKQSIAKAQADLPLIPKGIVVPKRGAPDVRDGKDRNGNRQLLFRTSAAKAKYKDECDSRILLDTKRLDSIRAAEAFPSGCGIKLESPEDQACGGICAYDSGILRVLKVIDDRNMVIRVTSITNYPAYVKDAFGKPVGPEFRDLTPVWVEGISTTATIDHSRFNPPAGFYMVSGTRKYDDGGGGQTIRRVVLVDAAPYRDRIAEELAKFEATTP